MTIKCHTVFLEEKLFCLCMFNISEHSNFQDCLYFRGFLTRNGRQGFLRFPPIHMSKWIDSIPFTCNSKIGLLQPLLHLVRRDEREMHMKVDENLLDSLEIGDGRCLNDGPFRAFTVYFEESHRLQVIAIHNLL